MNPAAIFYEISEIHYELNRIIVKKFSAAGSAEDDVASTQSSDYDENEDNNKSGNFSTFKQI